MRTYQIWLKDFARFVELGADDVNVDAAGSKEFFNFTIGPDGDAVTVGVFPYDSVEYVVALDHLLGGDLKLEKEQIRENQAAAPDQFSHPSGFGIVSRR